MYDPLMMGQLPRKSTEFFEINGVLADLSGTENLGVPVHTEATDSKGMGARRPSRVKRGLFDGENHGGRPLAAHSELRGS
jgi:hypothetical protein